MPVMKIINQKVVLAIVIVVTFSTLTKAQTHTVGIFEGQTDVGHVKRRGTAIYNASMQQYELSGSGSNIWFDHDQFHFVWRKIKGDFILRTNVAFIGKGVEAHRKVGLMVRSSLDSNATHVNVVRHGDGLTSLQFRKTIGGTTEEIKSSITGADVLQLERRGNTYTMSVARKGETFITEKTEVDLGDDVYVGLFICSHNPDVVERATFSNVRVVIPAKPNFVPYHDYIGSDIELLDVATQNSTIIYQSPRSLQAPNWMKDGDNLIYNSEGLLYKFNLNTHTPSVLNTGDAKQNNNDHVLSFDGRMLGISSAVNGASECFTVPVTGGQPERITKTGPSYTHGWSPNGKYLVFTGQRNGDFDIYRIPAKGGEEVRLTTAPGLDDGPEYSPDGKYIYFNSVRSGLMQIWRMKADGTQQTQLTNDDFDNWFPHVSPNGKWIVFIAFLKDEVKPDDHPFYRHVYIKLMPVKGGKPKVIAYLYGGQGTINTPSWSPDSKRIAFVSNTELLFPTFHMAK
jgi:WD40 repeat protein